VSEGPTGFHHPSVRAARLLHHKKHRLQRRCFLIEGPQLLEAALAAGARIEQVFVLDDGALLSADAIGRLGDRVLRVDRRTLDSLAQTTTPQGVVAVVGFVHHEADELERLVPSGVPAAVLVLADLSDPGNAGTLIRSAEAFGASAVCFGPHAVEPYNDKVVRASMGSLFRVPIVRYEEWQQFVTAAHAARLQIVGSDARGDDVRRVTLPDRAALIVGQERRGLDEIPRADFALVLALPQREGVESLNAGVAGSLLLYELGRAHGLFGPSRAGTTAP
jgi:RNA methyltransferase, TrmH family